MKNSKKIPTVVLVLGGFFACVIAVNIYFIVLSQKNHPQLVTQNYYEQSLRYDDDLASKKLAEKLGLNLKLEKGSQGWKVEFGSKDKLPTIQNGSTIHFYRPSASNMDKVLALNGNGESFLITAEKPNLEPGAWIARVKIKTEQGSLSQDFNLFI